MGFVRVTGRSPESIGSRRCAAWAWSLVAVVGLVLLIGRPAVAGEVLLKNGVQLEGKVVPIQGLTKSAIRQTQGPTTTYPIIMVHTGLQRYFVPARQRQEISNTVDLSPQETFELSQKITGRKLMFSSLGALTNVTPFDEHGWRRVTVQTSRGPTHIVQGITEINPRYVIVKGLTHVWEHGLATSSIPPEHLDAILREATDPGNPEDRMSIARFYLEAGLYQRAAKELESIIADFPQFRDRVAEFRLQLRELQAQQLLAELNRRVQAGQHRLAYTSARRFPTEEMSVDVLAQVRQLTQKYDDAREQAEMVQVLLGDFQAGLEDADQQKSADRMRTVVSSGLSMETLPRLDAFLKLQIDETLKPAEKLALAYSGWVLGSENAVTDFGATQRIWQARFLILQYLRADDDQTRRELVLKLSDLESVGPQTVLDLIRLLPPAVETPQARPGEILTINYGTVSEPNSESEEEEKTEETERPQRYHVLLPMEYSPQRSYPLLVCLRPAEHSGAAELAWWGGTAENPGVAQRRGYIAIAPEYAKDGQGKYDYSSVAHQRVVEAIRDARQRFPIDSDRIFLAGHGMGGDAAFDMGMSHPDLFAGVIPITGVSDHYTKWYWQNGEHTAWYIVCGELDRDSMQQNGREANRMMRYGFDIIYTEFIGRGYERYYDEIHKLFDWMDLHRRKKWPTDIEMQILRASDNRFWWVRGDAIPQTVAQTSVLAGGDRRAPIRPFKFGARVTPGNTIYITSPSDRNTLWLSPEFVDFDRRVAVRIRGRQKFNDFVRPSMLTILEDYRERGDRQMVYQAKLVVE